MILKSVLQLIFTLPLLYAAPVISLAPNPTSAPSVSEPSPAPAIIRITVSDNGFHPRAICINVNGTVECSFLYTNKNMHIIEESLGLDSCQSKGDFVMGGPAIETSSNPSLPLNTTQALVKEPAEEIRPTSWWFRRRFTRPSSMVFISAFGLDCEGVAFRDVIYIGSRYCLLPRDNITVGPDAPVVPTCSTTLVMSALTIIPTSTPSPSQTPISLGTPTPSTIVTASPVITIES